MLALGWQPLHAAGVVTNCSNDTQLKSLLAGGGAVTFNCGGNGSPATIVVNPAIALTSGSISLDGGNKVTLSGANANRVFIIDSGVFGTPPSVTLAHLTLTNGYAGAEPGGCMLLGFAALVVLDDVTVQNCRTDSGGQGGGIFGGLASSVLLRDSRLLNNEAGTGGGISGGLAPITLTRTLVASNRAISGTGGGLDAPFVTAVVTGSTFYSNSAVIGGGGISAAASAQLRITGSRVENNRARNTSGQTYGGGIRSEGTLTISTTTITGNVANVGQSSTWGGGIYHTGGALSLTDVIVQGNRSIHGAGVQVAGGVAAMNAVTITGNYATLASGDGGGLGIGAGSVSLAGSIVSGNYAAREGGGIYNRGALTVSRTMLGGNGAYNGGGGILNWFGSALVVSSTISGNSASGGGVGYGGGILNRNATMELTATAVCGNTAHYDGGGIYNEGALWLNGTTVCNNTMDGGDEVGTAFGGGGIFNAGNLIITSSTVSGNRVNLLDGGGLYNRNGTASVSNSTVNGNFAADDGGGIKNERGILTLQNTTLSGNSATAWGGGVLSDHGQSNLLHVTLHGNRAAAGGGIYNLTVYPTRTVYLQNTLVANNPGANCAQFAGSLDVVSGGYNASDDNAFNTYCPSFQGTDLSNVNANLGPLAHNGGATRTHLPLPGGTAIDAIPISTSGCGTTYSADQRLSPRPVDGNGDLVARCDIGAVEYVPGETTPWLYLPLIRR